METQDQFKPITSDTHDDVLKYSYRLDTIFDISRSLFTLFDPDTILRTCLLSTMGNFGVVHGFIGVFELPSREVIHFVAQGFQDNEIAGLQQAAAEIIDGFNFEKSYIIASKRHPEQPTLATTECILPFWIDQNHAGCMGVGPKILGGLYSENEKKFLVTLKNSLVVALQNAKSFEEIRRLNEDLVEKKSQLEITVKELEETMIKVADYSRHLEKIIAALNVAQEVQQNLLPPGPPEEKRLDIAGTTLYCDETGGDYYDYIALPCLGPDTWALVAGDVSGHGISSALLMAGVRAYLRGRAGQPGSAAEIITDVNRLVAADTTNTCQFMTLFFLVVDARDGRMNWVNAGHDPAMLYNPNTDRFEPLPGRGMPLGVMADCQYTDKGTILEPGQILVLTTDGALEAHNQKGDLFGKERFKEIIRRKASLNAEGILKAIVGSIEEFRGGAPQHDDITLVVLKFINDTTR